MKVGDIFWLYSSAFWIDDCRRFDSSLRFLSSIASSTDSNRRYQNVIKRYSFLYFNFLAVETFSLFFSILKLKKTKRTNSPKVCPDFPKMTIFIVFPVATRKKSCCDRNSWFLGYILRQFVDFTTTILIKRSHDLIMQVGRVKQEFSWYKRKKKIAQ